MARRTITDEEIALVKAMPARGMRNRDIQFFFNRPERAMNSGRITDIGTGKYSNAAAIARATDEELNTFLASRSPTVEVPLVVAPAEAETSSPLSEAALRRMFAEGAAGVWRLAAGETDQAECKAGFGLRHPAPWLRAVAALANSRGGYVFFGVGDKDPAGAHPVLGLATNEFADTDPAEIAKRLRAIFDPTPRFQRAVFEVGGKKVGVMYVDQHPSRPIIATKNEGGGEIKEGDIFFRYSGQSTRIKYADLRAMLDARDAQARADILPMVQRLLALGPARAMIADLAEGRLMDGKRTIELDEDIIKELNLIKEGEFKERTGAPALRLIGDVKAATPAQVKKGLVTRADMQRDFLADTLTADPLDYVRCAVEVTGSEWLPIRYFARAAGLSHTALIEFIDQDPAAIPAQQKLYRERLSSPDRAYADVKGPALDMLRRILAGEMLAPKDAGEARLLASAAQGLPRPLPLAPAPLRTLLARCAELIGRSADRVAKSSLRKGIARLDEAISS
jgi:Putative DNA-binding domain